MAAPTATANMHFDQVQEEYIKSLQRALDQATFDFMRTHPSLTSDQQKQLVAAWTDAQRQRPHRPDADHADAHATADGNASVTKKKKIVRAYIDGCYDLMHSGHYNAIRQAKSLCDELIVGLHTNEEIMRQKGPPVMSDEERLATVRACKWVDRVEFGTPYNPTIELLDSLGADFAVHGDDDCANADGVDAFAAVKAAGRMAIVKRTEGVSTTDLVNRLLQLTSDERVSPQPALPHTQALCASSPQLIHDAAHATNASANGGSPASSSSSAPVSTFLSTTWRISQFANHTVPKRTDKVVYIAGSFDMFHAGHIQKLEAAKKLGTFLYVGVYDDATVAHYKGRRHPVMSVHERVLNVLQCVHVDEVVIGAPFDVTQDLIKTLNVAVVARCKPCEASVRRTGTLLPDPTASIQSLDIVTDIQTPLDLHTDQVIQRILDNRAKYEARNEKRAAKEHAYAAQKVYVEEK